jgi:hypothetical protein
MSQPHTIIHIQPAAPAKPPLGAPCNGCGVCCLLEPCPVGMLLSRRRHGACAALRWDEVQARYRCGALVDAPQVARQTLPKWLAALAPVLASCLRRWGPRWIAAGQGCDSSVQVARPE